MKKPMLYQAPSMAVEIASLTFLIPAQKNTGVLFFVSWRITDVKTNEAVLNITGNQIVVVWAMALGQQYGVHRHEYFSKLSSDDSQTKTKYGTNMIFSSFLRLSSLLLKKHDHLAFLKPDH